jgi:DNA-binding NarL/FixJ family response regulator
VNHALHIYLADDHELVVNGIAALIQAAYPEAQIKTFHSGKQLLKACLAEKPTLVFLDYEMPEWNGLQTLQELLKAFPSLPCLMLSMVHEKSVIKNCLDQGAKGYLNKDCTPVELKEAIEAIQNGQSYLSTEAQKALDGQSNKTLSTFQLSEPLSERELEILTLFCDGMSPKEIADKLFLSPRTVETHKNNIMQKVGVFTVGKLISIALKHKLV